jgi:hypothetical protein
VLISIDVLKITAAAGQGEQGALAANDEDLVSSIQRFGQVFKGSGK